MNQSFLVVEKLYTFYISNTQTSSPAETSDCCIKPCASKHVPANVLESSDVQSKSSTDNHSSESSTNKIVFVSDSFLHRMNETKMRDGVVRSVKLTKPGDNLAGSVHKARNFLSRNQDTNVNMTFLAGTNDLRKRSVTPR